MKFIRYERNGEEAIGVLDASGFRVVDLAHLARDMGMLIEAWSEKVAAAVALAAETGRGEPLDAVRILAPFPSTDRTIFCVGKNYRDHAVEFERSGYDAAPTDTGTQPAYPVIFTKATSSVIGHDEGIPDHHEVTQALDYEAELAVVIGLGGKGIPKHKAWDHVFGYTGLNDVTARDLQRDHQQWLLGKSLDGFCPIGPYLVTRDEITGCAVPVKCWVNGELRQSANTADLIFDIPTLIATISAGITLRAGDLIATGTPSGVGAGSTPPRFLKAGDEVTVEIGGVGILSNRIVRG